MTVAVVTLTMAASHALLVFAPDGSPLRVIAALVFIFVPGLAWAELLLPNAEAVLRWTIGVGLGVALAIVTGLLLHAVPGPILLWQWVAAVDLLVLVPLVGLLATYNTRPTAVRTDRDRRLILLLLIMLVGGFFRFAGLGYSEYQGDEIEAVAPAARAIEGYEDGLTLQRRKAPAEVLLPMLMWRTTGVLTEGTARLPFAVAGLMIIPCCYVMGRRLHNTQAGLAAALIAALCGLLVAFSRVVQYQSIVVLMMALSLISAWEWRARGALLWAALAGLFLGIGLLAHYDAIVVAPALAYIAAVGVVRRRGSQGPSRRAMLVGGLVLTGTCLLTASLFYLSYLADPYFGTTSGYLAGRVGSKILYDNLANFLHVASFYNSFYFVVITGVLAWGCITESLVQGCGPRRLTDRWRWVAVALSVSSLVAWLGVWRFLGYQAAASVFVALLACALFSRRASAEEYSVVLWGGCAFLAFVFIVQKPGTHVYAVMAPLAVLAGVGAAKLWNCLRGKYAKGLTIAAVAALVMLLSGYLFAAYLRQDVKYWQDWPASRLSLYWTPEEYADPNGFAIFGMVHRSGWKAAGALLLQDQLADTYDSNEKPEVTVWYTRNAWRPSRDEQGYCGQKPQTMFIADDLVGAAGHYGVAPDFLAGYRRVGIIAQANGKGIAVYSSDHAPLRSTDLPGSAELEATFDGTATPGAFVHQPEPQYKLNANLDNKVLLLGYDLDCITPDGRVALTLYWQALAPLSADYHVFVHVAGGLEPGSPAGIWGQSDGVPGNVSTPLVLWESSRLLAGQPGGDEPLPTSRWRKGQVIRDRRNIQISADAPAASYALIAGLYQLETGERLQLMDVDNKPVSDYVKLREIIVPIPANEEQAVAAGPASP